MTADTRTPPDALLLLGTHCPYCPTVLKGLGELVKAGVIGKLEAVNIEQRPDIARDLGVRTAPWVRIGPFELEGLRSEQELREWAEKAGSADGLAAYLDELLSSGQIDKVLGMVRKDPANLDALLALFADTETQINTRIGISAIMEDLEGSELLQGLVTPLGELTRHAEAHIRADACHYLGMSGNRQASAWIRPLLEDSDADVREVAAESLAALEDG
jgi:thiol-disulfide isomerase/thioredoxin